METSLMERSEMELHDIGWAVRVLLDGRRVYRRGWNGANQFIELMKPVTFGDGRNGLLLPYVFIKTVNNEFVPWTCSQTDLLAEDWEQVRDFDG